MPEKKVQVIQYSCSKCEYEWIPRNKSKQPDVCPECKSYDWNKPIVGGSYDHNESLKGKSNHQLHDKHTSTHNNCSRSRRPKINHFNVDRIRNILVKNERGLAVSP